MSNRFRPKFKKQNRGFYRWCHYGHYHWIETRLRHVRFQRCCYTHWSLFKKKYNPPIISISYNLNLLFYED